MKTELSLTTSPPHSSLGQAARMNAERARTTAHAKPVTVQLQPEPVKHSSVQADLKEMNARIQDAIKSLNDQMKHQSRNLSFSYDDVTDKPVIVVKASDTGQVIRQIPDITFLRVAHSIESMKGLIMDRLS